MFISLEFRDYLLDVGLVEWEELFNKRVSFDGISEDERNVMKDVKTYELLRKRVAKLSDLVQIMEQEPAGFGYSVSRQWSKRLETYNYHLEVFPLFERFPTDEYRAVLLTSATADPEDLRQTLGIEGRFYRLGYNFDYSKVYGL